GDARVYMTEPDSDFLQKFTISGVPLLTFQDHAVHGASGIAIDSGGAIYMADARAGQIHVFFPEGDPLHTFSMARQRGAIAPQSEPAVSQSEPATPARASNAPFVFSIDADGTIFVPDPGGGAIQVLNSRGSLKKVWKI